MKSIAFKLHQLSWDLGDMLDIYTNPEYLKSLVSDIHTAFGACAELMKDTFIRVHINPRFEEGDIDKIKEFATKYIELFTGLKGDL